MNKATILFLLNIIDALLTLYWIEIGAATEGNFIMNYLLSLGVPVFLTAKIIMAAATAFVLGSQQTKRLARIGLDTVLTIYAALMLIHLITGFSHFFVK